MKRKECDNLAFRATSVRTLSALPTWLVGVVAVLAYGDAVRADGVRGEIRMWPSAVVVGENVRLDEVAELCGFDEKLSLSLARTIVAQAPAPGCSRYISMEVLRPAVKEAGANLAQVTLRGALRCAVSRPAQPTVPTAPPAVPVATRRGTPRGQARPHPLTVQAVENPSTLRQAVIDYFNAELERYAGTAELMFGHTDEQMLDLAGPDYVFSVVRQGVNLLGLVRFEVQVWSQGKKLQTVPLVARVTMMRNVVVARRAINQGATIRQQDVQVIPTSFTRLDKLGIAEPAQVVGQRARRFLRPGSTIDPAHLEAVPLVTRNQLVTVTTEVGSIAITTSGKAMETGGLGDVIRVHSVENRKLEYEAAIVGPGRVRMGSERSGTMLTSGSTYAQR